MKRFIFGSLSVLLVSVATAPAVKAEQMAVNLPTQQSTSTSTDKLTPAQVADLARLNYQRKHRTFPITIPLSQLLREDKIAK